MSKTFIEEVQEILTETFNEGKKRSHEHVNLVKDGDWVKMCAEQIVEAATAEFKAKES